LDSIFSWLLLGHKEIAQQHEHHEEHYHDNSAAEEKTHEFTGEGGGTGNSLLLRKFEPGDFSSTAVAKLPHSKAPASEGGRYNRRDSPTKYCT